jgi:diacylglycerol kinase (ATP)
VGSSVHLLGNPSARAGRAGGDLAAVAEALGALGAEVHPVAAPDRAGVRPSLAAALAAGAERVVVAGGDGLLHLAVQELAGTGVPVGIVPVGTGNDFARAVGIREHDVGAAAARALAEPVDLDLIRTDHGWVASVATLGFSATVNARANRLRWPHGARRYTVATLLEIPRFRARRLLLEVGDDRHELDGSLVAVANTAFFGGGMAICPDADPADGLLAVTVIGGVGRLELLRMLPTVYRAAHVRHRAVQRFAARTVRVATADGADLPGGIWGDGEPVGSLPVTLEAVPGALRLAGGRG